MTVEVVVIGAGGFGRETLDVLEAMIAHDPASVRVLGVVDDAPNGRNARLLTERAVPLLGTIEALLSMPTSVQYLIGIGSPRVRAGVARRLADTPRLAFTAVHPAATIGSRTRLGSGSVVCAGAQVSTNVEVGRHGHLNPACVIGHDAKIDDCVSINPGAVVSGDTHIGGGSLIGANATVLQGLNVGANSLVGASACVVRDVPPDTTVRGVPAR
jgi:sugar O-acyltransferase (sialic acid O-acetyltransferase NeuD family)